MSGLQRSSPRLKARVSPYHSGVTLYAMPDVSIAPPRTPRRPKIELSTPETPIASDASQSPSKRPIKTPQKSKTPYKKALAAPHPAPARWREVYDSIKEMRSKTVAPVDTMGCHMAQEHETDPKVANSYFPRRVSCLNEEDRTNASSRSFR